MTRSFLALLVFVAACSDAALVKFEGTWNIVAGSTVVSCNGMVTATPTSGDIVIALRSGAAIEVLDASGCDTAWTVSGSTATAKPAQMCNLGSDGGVSAVTLSTGTITTTDAKNLSYSYTGTVTPADPATPAGEACTYAATGTATHVPR